MTIEEVLIAIGIAVLAALVVSALGWIFRRQLSRALAALDMSAGGVFAWVMAFIMLAVIIVFPLIDVEIPGTVTVVFAFLMGSLAISTVWKRRQ